MDLISGHRVAMFNNNLLIIDIHIALIINKRILKMPLYATKLTTHMSLEIYAIIIIIVIINYGLFYHKIKLFS